MYLSGGFVDQVYDELPYYIFYVYLHSNMCILHKVNVYWHLGYSIDVDIPPSKSLNWIYHIKHKFRYVHLLEVSHFDNFVLVSKWYMQ